MIVLTLTSSDSANLYPDNEPGNFKNHLPGELKLEGGNWLIGLARIQIPITWPTLAEDEAAVKIYKPNVLRAVVRVTLPLTHFLQQLKILLLILIILSNKKEKI